MYCNPFHQTRFATGLCFQARVGLHLRPALGLEQCDVGTTALARKQAALVRGGRAAPRCWPCVAGSVYRDSTSQRTRGRRQRARHAPEMYGGRRLSQFETNRLKVMYVQGVAVFVHKHFQHTRGRAGVGVKPACSCTAALTEAATDECGETTAAPPWCILRSTASAC